ncbi:MAG TPA: NUDIX domain-containing protein [Bacteroidales bacterium]|nr:NUDIX domain-containing protein [Bacteroidales bacterium]
MSSFYQVEDKHLVAVDSIIFGYDIADKELKLLLIKRLFDPGKGEWSLPGGFVRKDEAVLDAACRVLHQLTGLKNVYMEQSYAYGEVDRDPGGRVITISHFALIKSHEIDPVMKESSAATWRSIKRLPKLIFDHGKMVSRALWELKEGIKIKPVGFELLPEKFTLVQLQDLYEAIYQRGIDKRNFRKKILSMNLLEKLEEKEKETSKRGAYYYKFLPANYEDFRRQGFYFNLDVS